MKLLLHVSNFAFCLTFWFCWNIKPKTYSLQEFISLQMGKWDTHLYCPPGLVMCAQRAQLNFSWAKIKISNKINMRVSSFITLKISLLKGYRLWCTWIFLLNPVKNEIKFVFFSRNFKQKRESVKVEWNICECALGNSFGWVYYFVIIH